MLTRIGDSLSNNNPRELISVAKEIIGKAETIGNWDKLGQAFKLLSYAYLSLELPDSALAYLYQARSFIDEFQDPKNKYHIYVELAKHYRMKEMMDSAIYYFEQSASIAQKTNEPVLIMTAYHNSAIIKSDLGRLAEAYEEYLKALEYADLGSFEKNKAVILNNLGLLDQKTGNFELAKQRYREAISINSKHNKYFDLSMNYANLALVFSEEKNADSALFFNEKTIELARERGFVRELARALNNSADILADNGQLDKAETYYQEAHDLCKQYNIIIGLYYTNLGMFNIMHKKGEYSKALKKIDEIREIGETLKDPEITKGIYGMYYDIYARLNNYEKAFDYLLRFNQLSDSIRSLSNENLVKELQAKFETEKKVLENRYLREELEIKKQQVTAFRFAIIASVVAILVIALLFVVQTRNRNRLKVLFNNLNVLNKEINQKNLELLESNQTKDKLFSVIAHDLKSPFNALLGILGILVEDKENLKEDERNELTEQLYKQTMTTYGGLENLLQWSMSQRKMFSYKASEFPLRNTIAQEILLAEGRATQKNISIVNELPEDLIVISDEQLLRNIARNLINNSIKYCHSGGAVRVRSELNNGNLTIIFSDNGTGMPKEKLEQLRSGLFVESVRGTKNEKGTGLGLQMVAEFAKLIGAEFQIDSVEGQGTDVYITLPSQSVKAGANEA
ncbi:MAG: tetratricopeptide repeat-containing sensor histidine kinase [Bacteroidetes bacterium]|nr:tetratricopeptide repeat-containing sensor histidine kinase [Bacteroidota bacterium]